LLPLYVAIGLTNVNATASATLKIPDNVADQRLLLTQLVQSCNAKTVAAFIENDNVSAESLQIVFPDDEYELGTYNILQWAIWRESLVVFNALMTARKDTRFKFGEDGNINFNFPITKHGNTVELAIEAVGIHANTMLSKLIDDKRCSDESIRGSLQYGSTILHKIIHVACLEEAKRRAFTSRLQILLSNDRTKNLLINTPCNLKRTPLDTANLLLVCNRNAENQKIIDLLKEHGGLTMQELDEKQASHKNFAAMVGVNKQSQAGPDATTIDVNIPTKATANNTPVNALAIVVPAT